MIDKNLFRKNALLYRGLILTVLEGLLSGSNYAVIYAALKILYDSTASMQRIFSLPGLVGTIFAIRLVVYNIGYTQSQIGGVEVSRNIRLGLDDKFRKLPLSGFTEKHEGQCINITTVDVSSCGQILTHKLAFLTENRILSVIVIFFVGALYFPVAVVLLFFLLLLLPKMRLSFRIVEKYGKEKNAVTAEAVEQIVEYTDGIQAFRAYGVGGTKNRNTTAVLRKFSTVSYQHEAHGTPANFTFNVANWLTVPLIIWAGFIPWQPGAVHVINPLLLCIMSIVLVKLTAVISADMFSYRNLLISKTNTQNLLIEKEESKSKDIFSPKEHGVSFYDMSFFYVERESALKKMSFAVPDHKLTAIASDPGSGRSTILNLTTKYYNLEGGGIDIGEQSVRYVNAEDVLDIFSMIDRDMFLFHEIVRESICHANPSAMDEEIEIACKRANCDTLIRKMKRGYDNSIGENGSLLSDGERQRLSIARVILKNSPISLLDEAISSLDIEDELAVRQVISNLLQKNKIVVMVAHTSFIIKNTARILIVVDGKVAEFGAHEQLSDLGGKCTAMWNAEQAITA